ncbi:MAG TPA: winged helix-turn-helix domain-containing protein [Candidatus Elarobacter sp.]
MSSRSVYSFGPFRLDVRRRKLFLNGGAIALRPRTFLLLEYLARNPGRLVSRSEMSNAIWPGEVVSEQNVAQQVYLIRSTLAAGSRGETYIVTEPGRGYRFVAEVAVEGAPAREATELDMLCLQGRYHWERRTADGLRKAAEYFREAISRDVRYAPAHAGLADTLVIEGEYLIRPPADTFPEARRAAERALRLDPNLAGAWAVLAEVALFFDRDFADASRLYTAALMNDPESPTILLYRSWFHHIRGSFAEALDDVRAAHRRAPYDLNVLTARGLNFVFRREYRAAVDQLGVVLGMEPDFPAARYYRALARLLSGDAAGALEDASPTGRPEREQTDAALSAMIAYRAGDAARAAEMAERVERLRRGTQFVSSFNVALPLIGARRYAAAIEALAAGLRARDPWIVYALHHPVFDELRGDARFDALTAEVLVPEL